MQKVFRLNGQTFLDQIAPAFLLFHFWGRIGCFCRLLLRKTRRLGNCHAADTGRATHSDSVDRNGLSACYFHRTAPAAAPKVPCSCAPDLSHFLCSLPVCAGIFPWGRIARHLAGPLHRSGFHWQLSCIFALAALLTDMNHRIHHTENWRKMNNEKKTAIPILLCAVCLVTLLRCQKTESDKSTETVNDSSSQNRLAEEAVLPEDSQNDTPSGDSYENLRIWIYCRRLLL